MASNAIAGNEHEAVTLVPVVVTVVLAANANALAQTIRERIFRHAAEQWEIGMAVDANALHTPIYSVEGAILAQPVIVAAKNAAEMPNPNNEPNANVLFVLEDQTNNDISVS